MPPPPPLQWLWREATSKAKANRVRKEHIIRIWLCWCISWWKLDGRGMGVKLYIFVRMDLNSCTLCPLQPTKRDCKEALLHESSIIFDYLRLCCEWVTCSLEEAGRRDEDAGADHGADDEGYAAEQTHAALQVNWTTYSFSNSVRRKHCRFYKYLSEADYSSSLLTLP